MEQDVVQNLKIKIDRLISRYEALKVENDGLRSRLDSVSLLLETKTQKINTLEKQLNNLQLTSALEGGTAGGDGAAAKRKVEKLIGEIDRCIGLLGD